MKYSSLIIVLICSIFVQTSSAYKYLETSTPEQTRSKLPEFNISLDDSFQTRMRPIVSQLLPEIKAYLQVFFKNNNSSLPQISNQQLQSMYRPTDFGQKISDLAELVGVSFSEILWPSLYVEVYAFENEEVAKECTSIVVRNKGGRIFHGRNWDQLTQQEFGAIVMKVHHYRGDSLAYSTVELAGLAAVLHGVLPQKFSMSINFRQGNLMGNLVDMIKEGALPVHFLIERALTETNSFDDAVKLANETAIITPAYYIIGGTKGNEGVVIERDQNSINAFYSIDQTQWFLVQTNSDRDQPAKNDNRRYQAEQKLTAAGNTIDETGLFLQVMYQEPNYNGNTIVTTIMNAQMGWINSTKYY